MAKISSKPRTKRTRKLRLMAAPRQPQASQIATGVLIGTLGTRAKNALMRYLMWAGVIFVIYVILF